MFFLGNGKFYINQNIFHLLVLLLTIFLKICEFRCRKTILVLKQSIYRVTLSLLLKQLIFTAEIILPICLLIIAHSSNFVAQLNTSHRKIIPSPYALPFLPSILGLRESNENFLLKTLIYKKRII